MKDGDESQGDFYYRRMVNAWLRECREREEQYLRGKKENEVTAK